MYWKETSNVSVDTLIATIQTEMISTGGWSCPDAGYAVIRNPTSKFDIFMFLDALGTKRWIQFQVGTWDTAGHTMPNPKLNTGHLIRNSASSVAGDELGDFKLSYDDTYVVIFTDYRSVGYNAALNFTGLLEPFNEDDECLICADTTYRGTPLPTNDNNNSFQFTMLKDLSGTPNKPGYGLCYIAQSITLSSGVPRGLTYSAKPDKRFMCPLWASSSPVIAGSENAGIRARFPDVLMMGYLEDIESHGTTVTDGVRTWMRINADVSTQYYHLSVRNWVRTE